MLAMVFSPFVAMAPAPSVQAAPANVIVEAAPSLPAATGVNEDGNTFIVQDAAIVNNGVIPVVGSQNVPVDLWLNSSVMDDKNETNGDDVLWNVTVQILPVFEWWNGQEWVPTDDISFTVDMASPEMWIEEEGPQNALWIKWRQRNDQVRAVVHEKIS